MPSPDTPGVIAPPPLIFAGALAAASGAAYFIGMPRLPALPARITGGLLLAVGPALAGTAVALMRRSGTHFSPYEPTTAIVETGPYRWTRNPIYLGMALAYAGASLLERSALPLLVLPGVIAVIDRGVIAREERYLEDKFGDRYLAYKLRVRRWL